jgi:hypothetical protein
MIAFLVLLANMGEVASGCRSSGSAVHCELAAPAPFVAPPIQQDRVVLKTRPVSTGLRMAPKRIARAQPSPDRTAPSPAAIDQHIASLVAIEDCTGARTFARSVGADALGERTFAQCVRGPTPDEARSVPRTVAPDATVAMNH